MNKCAFRDCLNFKYSVFLCCFLGRKKMKSTATTADAATVVVVVIFVFVYLICFECTQTKLAFCVTVWHIIYFFVHIKAAAFITFPPKFAIRPNECICSALNMLYYMLWREKI